MTEYDVVVVGTGFGGLYALYELRRRGYSVLALEAGGGVGGCWYWNRYPGARVDVYSLSYSYSFSPELEQDWEWSEFFAAQPELEAYANHVADRFDLRRDIRLGVRVRSADWDEAAAHWTVRGADGTEVRARRVVWATGGYSKPAVPDIDGLADFAGEVLHAPVWPDREVDHAGRRIGVVGTGASGLQIIQELAAQPIGHLTVFQRTAEYAYPAGRIANDPEWVRAFKTTAATASAPAPRPAACSTTTSSRPTSAACPTPSSTPSCAPPSTTRSASTPTRASSTCSPTRP
jgi:cation diffusion facilitator CzcD-associated flavoprotein CzcO